MRAVQRDTASALNKNIDDDDDEFKLILPVLELLLLLLVNDGNHR